MSTEPQQGQGPLEQLVASGATPFELADAAFEVWREVSDALRPIIGGAASRRSWSAACT